MTSAMREAARAAARLQWIADRYRYKGERNDVLEERTERLTAMLDGLAASTLCRGFE